MAMRQSRKLLLLGSGGHYQSVTDSLLSLSIYDEIGIVSKNGTELSDLNNSKLLGLFEVGKEENLTQLFQNGYKEAFITVGSIGNPATRRRLYQILKQIGFYIPNIIDRSAVVSVRAELGEGIYVGKNAVINAYSIIGNCAIINTASVIEHSCYVGDFVHVAPGSTLCGEVIIAEGTHIGAGSVIKQGVHIGSESMIGMGSIVLHDIEGSVVAYGNPCKVIKS